MRLGTYNASWYTLAPGMKTFQSPSAASCWQTLTTLSSEDRLSQIKQAKPITGCCWLNPGNKIRDMQIDFIKRFSLQLALHSRTIHQVTQLLPLCMTLLESDWTNCTLPQSHHVKHKHTSVQFQVLETSPPTSFCFYVTAAIRAVNFHISLSGLSLVLILITLGDLRTNAPAQRFTSTAEEEHGLIPSCVNHSSGSSFFV